MASGVLVADIPFSAGDTLTEAHLAALRSALRVSPHLDPAPPSPPRPPHAAFHAQTALLEEARAMIQTLQSAEAADVQRLRHAAEAQLTEAAARAAEMHAKWREAGQRALGAEADLVLSQLRCEELTILNRHLTEQLRLLGRLLASQGSAAEFLQAEAQRHSATAEQHAAANARLQLQVRDLGAELRGCIDTVERLERRSAAQEQDWADRLAAATSAADHLTQDNAALRLAVQQAEEQLVLTREACGRQGRTLQQTEMELERLRAEESHSGRQLSELQSRCQQQEDTIRGLRRNVDHLWAEQEAAAMALEDHTAQRRAMEAELGCHRRRAEELSTCLSVQEDCLRSFSTSLGHSLSAIRLRLTDVLRDYPSPAVARSLDAEFCYTAHASTKPPSPEEPAEAAVSAVENQWAVRLRSLERQAAAVAEQLEGLAEPSVARRQLTALRPHLEQLYAGLARLAARHAPGDAPPASPPEDPVACAAASAALCCRMEESLEHCANCSVLQTQLAAQQRLLAQGPGQWEAEEARQRQCLAQHHAELRGVLLACQQWVAEYDAARQQQRGREESLRKWDAQERQQRRSIATAEAEAWAKLCGMAQRFQRWRLTAEGRPPERRKPTVAWIGIEISDLRSPWPVPEGRPSDAAEVPVVPSEGPEAVGVKVVAVKGPAFRQGVMVGDTITQLNDRPTVNLSSFKCAAAKVKPGQTVHLSIIRPNVAQRVLISVQTFEVDKELFTPGVRHTQKVPLARPDSLIVDTREKENRVPLLDILAPFLPASNKNAADGDDKAMSGAPRIRCRSAGTCVRPSI
eukprot:EG_transcript_2719